VTVAPSISDSLSRRTLDFDFRHYLRLGSSSVVFATRARGFTSGGSNPEIFYFGGNMELRGYSFLSFAGNEGFFANAELRFPIIDIAKTPIGLIGPLRGAFYAGVGGARFRDQKWKFGSGEDGRSYVNDQTLGEPVSGYHLVDAKASYGFGIQLFFLGYPLHFDWSKQTDIQTTANARLDFWIGFDF
jgi:outer membrane protein assembly factor BamA